MGSIDQSLHLKSNTSILSQQQLHALGFIQICQPLPIKKGGEKILKPQLILVVVAIYHRKNLSWLPGFYDKNSHFLEAGKCATGKGSMIGFLRKDLLDTKKSRPLDKSENIPVVIVDDNSSLHWLSERNNNTSTTTITNPTTPNRTTAERLTAMRDMLMRQAESPAAGPSTTPTAPSPTTPSTKTEIPPEPTTKSMLLESSTSGMWKSFPLKSSY
jgi:hypothetical protein